MTSDFTPPWLSLWQALLPTAPTGQCDVNGSKVVPLPDEYIDYGLAACVLSPSAHERQDIARGVMVIDTEYARSKIVALDQFLGLQSNTDTDLSDNALPTRPQAVEMIFAAIVCRGASGVLDPLEAMTMLFNTVAILGPHLPESIEGDLLSTAEDYEQYWFLMEPEVARREDAQDRLQQFADQLPLRTSEPG